MAGRAKTGRAAELCRTVYPELVGEARAIARQHGYAIGVHGSLLYDLDLIAVPWVEECAAPYALVTKLREGMTHCLGVDEATVKPHGRAAFILAFPDGLHVDLSIFQPPSEGDEG